MTFGCVSLKLNWMKLKGNRQYGSERSYAHVTDKITFVKFGGNVCVVLLELSLVIMG